MLGGIFQNTFFQADRDYDYCKYTLKYNKSISTFHNAFINNILIHGTDKLTLTRR